MSREDFDWKKYLLECMNSTDYCSIATVDPNRAGHGPDVEQYVNNPTWLYYS